MKKLLLALTLLSATLVPALSSAEEVRADRAGEAARLKEARADIRAFAEEHGVTGEGRLQLRTTRGKKVSHLSYTFEKIGGESRNFIEGRYDRTTHKVVKFEVKPLLLVRPGK